MNYIKFGMIAALLVALWYLWDSDRDAYADKKVSDVITKTKEEANKDWGEKIVLGNKRLGKALEAAETAKKELDQLKEMLDEKDSILAARDRLIGGLRSTIVRARRNEVSADPASVCRAQELRAEQLAGILQEGQRLCVEVAETLGEGVGLVLACEAGARRDAVMLRWAQRHISAVEVGSEPPPMP